MRRNGAARITPSSARRISRSCVSAKPRSSTAPSYSDCRAGCGSEFVSKSSAVAPCISHVVEELFAIDFPIAHVINAHFAHGHPAAAFHGRVHHGGDAEPVARDHRLADFVAVQ